MGNPRLLKWVRHCPINNLLGVTDCKRLRTVFTFFGHSGGGLLSTDLANA